MTRALLSIALVVASTVATMPTASAQNQDSAAVAVNQKDGKSVFKLAFSVRRVMNDDVDADNAAVAYASCNDCRTIVASIQVVLVMADPGSVTTDNLAMALNYQCSSCETMALAYQYVVGNGQPVRFTADGNRRLADVRRRLQELRRRNDLTLEQLAGEVAALAAEVAEVVGTELVPTGGDGAPGQRGDTATTTTGDEPTSATGTSTTTTAEDETTTTTVGSTTTTVGSATTVDTSSSTTSTTSTTTAP